LVAEVADGQYEITVALGDMAVARDQMGVYLEDQLVDTVDTAAGQINFGVYTVNILDGLMTLRLKDLGGSNPLVSIVALDIVKVGPAFREPSAVLSSTLDAAASTTPGAQLPSSQQAGGATPITNQAAFAQVPSRLVAEQPNAQPLQAIDFGLYDLRYADPSQDEPRLPQTLLESRGRWRIAVP
jgi:hypothetical protein